MGGDSKQKKTSHGKPSKQSHHKKPSKASLNSEKPSKQSSVNKTSKKKSHEKKLSKPNSKILQAAPAPPVPLGSSPQMNPQGYPYQQAPNAYQQAPNPYQQAPNPYQQVQNPYQQQQAPNPYQQAPNPYQQVPNPYQQVPNAVPYQQAPYGATPYATPYSAPIAAPMPAPMPAPVVLAPPPPRDPNCPAGLEYLTQIDQLLVIQEVDMLQVFTGYESHNRYSVKNAANQNVYYAVEMSDILTMNFLHSDRPFNIVVMDNFGAPILRASRPYRFGSVLCGCPDLLEVTTGNGQPLGTIQEQFKCCAARFNIFDASGNVVLFLEGPGCSCDFIDTEFEVLTASDESKVGAVTRKFPGFAKELFTHANVFGVNFPIDLAVEVKALLLASCFLIDFMYYQQKDGEKDKGLFGDGGQSSGHHSNSDKHKHERSHSRNRSPRVDMNMGLGGGGGGGRKKSGAGRRTSGFDMEMGL